MRVEELFTASGTFLNGLLASFISLHSLKLTRISACAQGRGIPCAHRGIPGT